MVQTFRGGRYHRGCVFETSVPLLGKTKKEEIDYLYIEKLAQTIKVNIMAHKFSFRVSTRSYSRTQLRRLS